MIQDKLNEIAAFVKLYNPYFDRYFSFVEMSDATGLVHNGNELVFPADYLGDYFYIRVPSKLGVIYDNSTNNADRSIGLSTPLVLVAIMADSDPYKLALNLMSTIGRMCNISKQFTSIVIHGEDVVAQELAKCEESVIEKALQNMQNGVSYVSVNFTMTYTQPFTALNCIQKPCKTCS